MSRYIEVNDVANAIYHHFPSIRTMADARGIIEEAPSIDIVRCKECKYFIDNLTEDDTDEVYGECCFDWDIKMPKADDFCSYGERRVSDDGKRARSTNASDDVCKERVHYVQISQRV